MSDDTYTQYRDGLRQDDATAWAESRLSGSAAADSAEQSTPELTAADAAASGGKGPLDIAGSVIRDIGTGLAETPRATVNGAINAVQETLRTAHHAATYLNEKLGLGGLVKGPDGLHMAGADEWRAAVEAQRAKGEDSINLPKLPEPSSVTGGMVESAAQFATAFAGAGKVLEGMGLAADMAPTALASAKGMMANFAAFDPYAKRLSNLIQQVPALANPITDYLQADPNDPEPLARLKNAVEGMGWGAVADGVMNGITLLKQWYRARAAVQSITPSADEMAIHGALGGSPDEPLVKGSQEGFALKPKAGGPDLAPGDALKAPEQPATYINFSRIDTPEDVQAVTQRIADTYKRSIDKATRGTQTFAEIQLNADQQNAWKVLSERRIGEPLNAEQSVAARNLWASSAQKVTETAQLASTTPSPQNLFAFQKMLAIHRAIQDQVIGARTETARALASWRIPSQAGAAQLADIDRALAGAGGRDTTELLAARVAALANNPVKADKLIESTANANTMDLVKEAFVNALLSGPKTHLVNAMSNTTTLMQQVVERHVASVLGEGDGVVAGEAGAQIQGLANGMRDAFRNAAHNFATGESGMGLGGTKVELAHPRSWSSEALGISESGWLGKTVDALGAYGNVPVRALGMVDEFYKTLGYRSELYAQAYRQATQEGLAGDALKSRMADIVANPPQSVHLAAVDQALYQTFQNAPGKFAKLVQQMVATVPGLKFIIPFVRTPANIMTYAFERTPLGLFMNHVRADLAAGGARGDLASARLAMGTATTMVAADLAMNGHLTGKGPSNTAERQAQMREGWQPYSVKIGDRFYAYNRFDPMGSILGLAADTTELLANTPYGTEKQKSVDRVVTATALAAANNMLNKTYLTGLSNLVAAVHDPDQYGEGFFQSLIGSAMPTGAFEIAKMNDPMVRQALTIMDTLQKRTPGLSEGLPARRDLWGRPLTYQSGLGGVYDALSPINSRRLNPEPIDKEILNQQMSVHDAPSDTSLDGIRVDLDNYPHAYETYVRMAGNDLKSPSTGMGCKDFLNAMVSGKSPYSALYAQASDGPEGGKAKMVQSVIDSYRDLARNALLRDPTLRDAKDIGDLRAYIADQKIQARKAAMTPGKAPWVGAQ